MLNNRLMKSTKDALEGTVVVLVRGEGNILKHSYRSVGLFVDTLGTIYVTELLVHRVIRWSKDISRGTAIKVWMVMDQKQISCLMIDMAISTLPTMEIIESSIFLSKRLIKILYVEIFSLQIKLIIN